LPKLARHQSTRHVLLAVLAALAMVAALELWPAVWQLAVVTIGFGALAIVVVLWWKLFPIERMLALAFHEFKKHLEETWRGAFNGVRAPTSSEIKYNRHDDDDDDDEGDDDRRRGGPLSGLVYLVIVLAVAAAVLAAGYYGLQGAYANFKFACDAADNARVLTEGLHIPE